MQQSPGKVAHKFLGTLLVCVVLILRFAAWHDGQTREHGPEIAAGLEAGIEPHTFVRDDVWVKNGSGYSLRNLRVTVVALQHGKRIDGCTLTLPELRSGQKYVWPGVLWLPGGEIGRGTTILVTGEEMGVPRIFTF